MSVPNFLITMLKEQYGEKIANKIIHGYDMKRPVTLRVNTLKANVEDVKNVLAKESIEFENVEWDNNVLIIKNVREKDLQELNLYKNGEIYLQSLSSILPPIILNPQENTDILDMAAAPGGKTTEIAALSNNNANITACEMNKVRFERLKYNIEKQGAKSVYTMQIDSRNMNDFFSFDQILLDAPCSGSGTLNSDDENIEKYFTTKLIEKSQQTQIQMLRKALKILKPGKEMVYSTCSILSCENEEIVNKILKETGAEIVPIDLDKFINIELLPTKIDGTMCVCPNELYEGFFIAKIKKNK